MRVRNAKSRKQSAPMLWMVPGGLKSNAFIVALPGGMPLAFELSSVIRFAGGAVGAVEPATP